MTLYVVATPIGNLGDLSPRALDVLRSADVIACEDTRVTGRLTHHFGIDTPLVSFHAHSSPAAMARLVDRLRSGEQVALVSDAGTPCISDPGRELVEAARAQGIDVVPIPGPSALITALSAVGLPSEPLLFLGFLPRSGKRREQQLRWIAQLPVTAVLYEAPLRVPATLRELAERLGDRPAAVVRELTKRFESIAVASLQELAAQTPEPPRGEVVIVVAPSVDDEASAVDETERTSWVEEAARSLALGVAPSRVAKDLAARSGRGRKEAYQWVLQAQRGSGDLTPE
jgi:16S rRNA (cytidine1402-2'-O)-methyltransferase